MNMTTTSTAPPLIRDSRTDDVAQWFVDHHAIFNTRDVADDSQWEIQTLYWGKPGTGVYSIRYVIMGPVLMVWGDLESAVYRWSSPITWKFLAGCDLQYFAGKCEASPKGRDYEDYDRDLALTDFNDAIKRRREEGYDNPDPQLVDDARRAIKYGADEWHEWMRADGYKLFGDGWYEWVPGLGKRTAQTCLAHLLGIKIAVAQRAGKGRPQLKPSFSAVFARFVPTAVLSARAFVSDARGVRPSATCATQLSGSDVGRLRSRKWPSNGAPEKGYLTALSWLFARVPQERSAQNPPVHFRFSPEGQRELEQAARRDLDAFLYGRRT